MNSDAHQNELRYRCVCGELIRFSKAKELPCDACGRRYSAAVIAQAAAETLAVAPNGDDSIELPAELPSRWTHGHKLGHYKIQRKLGQGGMGGVYQALDESLQRYVALKVIRSDVLSSGGEQQLDRLMQEAVAQARVNHPNVVHIYYVGLEEESPFFAMELVNGPTLAERLAEGPIPFTEVVRIARQLVAALKHAAQFDIIHGDIKPAKVLLADGQTVKLYDFGLARRLSEQENQPAGIAGTPNYVAPEVVRGQSSDLRSAMYSLGVTLFEMTFGRLPYTFSGSSLQERLKTHETAAIEFPVEWPEDVPLAWRQVLERLLAKEADDRYEDYDAVLADLADVCPVTPPVAGRVPRAFAWMVDIGLANAAIQIVYWPFSEVARNNGIDVQNAFLRTFIAFSGLSIPLLAAYLQSWRKTTPGKRLFQLRIVDRNGLTTRQVTLAIRVLIQLIPSWTFVVDAITTEMHLVPLGNLITALASLFIAVNIVVTVITCRSLQDFLLGTRVVLNA